MRTPEQLQKIQTLVVDFGKTLISLYSRWLDECQYEDFKEYEAVMKAKLEENPGISFIKGSKRPFGCTFAYDGLKVKVSLNKSKMSWVVEG
jgi:hypothetical protein